MGQMLPTNDGKIHLASPAHVYGMPKTPAGANITPTDAEIRAMARAYDLYSVNKGGGKFYNKEAIAANENPDLMFQIYGNSNQTHDGNFPDNWISHKIGGAQRFVAQWNTWALQPDQFNGTLYQGVRGWRAFNNNQLRDALSSSGTWYDTYFLDSAGTYSWTQAGRPAKPPGFTNDYTWAEWAAIHYPNALYWKNQNPNVRFSLNGMEGGISTRAGGTATSGNEEYWSYWHIGMAENVMRSNTGTLPDHPVWRDEVNMAIDGQVAGTGVWWYFKMFSSSWAPWRNFGCPSYFIAEHGKLFFELGGKEGSDPPWRSKEYENLQYRARLGPPLETFGSAAGYRKVAANASNEAAGGIYGRYYTNGVSLVNTAGVQLSYTLDDRQWRTLSGAATGLNQTLAPKTGLILTSTTGGGGPDPPPTGAIVVASEGPHTLRVSASDPNGIAQVRERIDAGVWDTMTNVASTNNWQKSLTFSGTPGQTVNHTVEVEATDAYSVVAERRTSTTSRTVSVQLPPTDSQPPTLTVTTPAGNITVPVTQDTYDVTGTASDNIALNRVTVNGENATLNPDGTFLRTINLNFGQNTVRVVAWDDQGLSSTTERTVTRTDDTTSPTLTVTAPATASVTVAATDTTYTVTGTASDNVGISEVLVNGEIAVLTGATNAFNHAISLAPGTNPVNVGAFDAAGNTTSIERAVIRPGGVTTVLADDDFSTTVATGLGTPDVGAAWVYDQGAASDFTVDGTLGVGKLVFSATNQIKSASVVNIADGDMTNIFVFPVVNQGGNAFVYARTRWTSTAGWHQRIQWLLRASDGHLIATPQVAAPTAATIPGGADTDFGVYTPGTLIGCRIRVEGTSWKYMIWLGPGSLSNWTQELTETTVTGAGKWQIAGQRGTGNTVAAPAAFAYFEDHVVTDAASVSPADTTPPTVAITSPANGASLPNGTTSITVSGTASDNVALASVNVNGVAATITSGTWSATAVPLTPGQNVLTATAADTATPTANTKSVSITVTVLPPSDTTAPVLSVVTPDRDDTVQYSTDTQLVVGTATDNVAVTLLTVNGQSVTVGGGGAFSTTVSLAVGSNPIVIIATDAAFNTARTERTITRLPEVLPPDPQEPPPEGEVSFNIGSLTEPEVIDWKIVHLDNELRKIGEVKPEALRFGRYLKRPGYINYQMDLSSHLAALNFTEPYRTNFEVYRNGVRLLAGMHTSVEVDTDVNYLSVAGQGWLHYLERRLFPFGPGTDLSARGRAWYDRDIRTIMSDILDELNAGTRSMPFTYRIPETGIKLSYKIEPNDTESIFDKINSFSEELPGFDFEMDDDRVLRVYVPEQGRHNHDYMLELGKNIKQIHYTSEGILATHVLAVGASERGFGIPNSDLADAHWRHDLAPDYGTVKNISRLRRIANADAAKITKPKAEMWVTVQPQSFDEVWRRVDIGDRLHVKASLPYMQHDDHHRLTGLEGYLNEERDEQFVFTFGDDAEIF